MRPSTFAHLWMPDRTRSAPALAQYHPVRLAELTEPVAYCRSRPGPRRIMVLPVPNRVRGARRERVSLMGPMDATPGGSRGARRTTAPAF